MLAVIFRPVRLVFALSALMIMPAFASGEKTAHDFGFTAIEGDPLPMASFAGKPVLVVNTASRCGFTYQYDGLQALYDRYRDEGLVVLGVPSQDFRQELATSEDVKKFCEINFDLDFPMTEIEKVKGNRAHPLFRWLAERGATPDWNFNKFLIAPDGTFVAKYGSSVKPDSDKIADDVRKLL
jgi:glutathione peroxidase